MSKADLTSTYDLLFSLLRSALLKLIPLKSTISLRCFVKHSDKRLMVFSMLCLNCRFVRRNVRF